MADEKPLEVAWFKDNCTEQEMLEFLAGGKVPDPSPVKFTRQGVKLEDLFLADYLGWDGFIRWKKAERMSAKRKARVPCTDGSRG
jgi:hypothetical protein